MDDQALRPARWHITKASVRGKSHVDFNLPNQDYFEILSSSDGSVVAAAICDGAGSADWSQFGARTTCQLAAPCLFEIGIRLQNDSITEGGVRDRIMRSLEEARTKLARSGIPLSKFHCTIAMCVLAGRQGYVGQIGDSIALSTAFSGTDGSSGRLDFFPAGHTQLFQPDRGEYANETHFITEPDWLNHLRLNAIDAGKLDALLLMTDGAMDVAMIRGRVFRGFLSNLIGKLLTLPAATARDQVLTEWLSDPRTHRATADDKTMFIAIRAGHERLAERPFVVEDDLEHASATAQAPQLPHPPAVQSNPAPPQKRDAPLVTLFAIVVVVVALAILFSPDIADSPARPVAGTATSELVVEPNDQTALTIPGGASVEFSLRTVAAEQVQIESLQSVPESSLHIDADHMCSQRLTPANPVCVLRLSVQTPTPTEHYELRIRYRNLRSGRERQLRLTVRSTVEE